MGLFEELIEYGKTELRGVAQEATTYLGNQVKSNFTKISNQSPLQPQPIAEPSTPLPSIPISPGSAALMSPFVLLAIGAAAYFMFKGK